MNSYLDRVAESQLRASSNLLADYDSKLRHHLDRHGEGLAPRRLAQPSRYSFDGLVSHSVDFRKSVSRDRRDTYLDKLNSSLETSFERKPFRNPNSSLLDSSFDLRDRLFRSKWSALNQPCQRQLDNINRLKDKCFEVNWRERDYRLNSDIPYRQPFTGTYSCSTSAVYPLRERQEIVVVKEPRIIKKRCPIRKSTIVVQKVKPVKKSASKERSLKVTDRKGLLKLKKHIENILKPPSKRKSALKASTRSILSTDSSFWTSTISSRAKSAPKKTRFCECSKSRTSSRKKSRPVKIMLIQ